jgi:hypothetical protein
VFNGRVGNTAALVSLTTDASNLGGNAVFNAAGTTGAASVITSGAQTYNDDVTLGANVVMQSTVGGNLTFNRTVNGAFSLEANTGGDEVFNGVLGGVNALASLTTDAALTGGQTQFNMDVALAPAGKAGVNVTGKVTVNDSVAFGSANGSAAQPTLRTGGGQEYNVAAGTVATFSKDAVLTDTAAKDITFHGTLDGPRGVTVNTGGNTTFAANIGQTSPLASVSTDAAGATILPALVTTSGNQNFADPVTLTANTTLASNSIGSLNLLSTVNAAGNSLTLSTSGNATLGATVSNLTSLNPSVAGTTTVGTAGTNTSIIVPGPLLFPGPVAVAGTVTIATTKTGSTAQIVNTGAALTFLQTVNGPGSLIASAGGTLTFASTVGLGTALNSLSATAPIINLNSTRTSGLLQANALPATVTDGSDGLLNLIGGSYSSLGGSVQFNPTNRTMVSKHATILSATGNVLISAAGSFFMGNEQKLLVNNGSLTISAGGSATLGDLAASTSMSVTAGSVQLQGRALNGFFNQNRKDNGLGFVSPNITFNTGSISFVPGTNAVAVFSTRDNVASVRQIPGVSLEIDPNIANQFGQQDLKLDSVTFQPVNPHVLFGTIQPIASGTRVTDPGQVQVIFVLEIPTLVELPQDTFLSKSDQDILARMGIYPREPTSDENITVSLRQGVFRQPIEGKAQMDDPEYTVVVNRLTTEEVKAIVQAYTDLAGKDFSNLAKIAAILAEQVKKFQEATPGAIGLDGFQKWLAGQRTTDKSADELAKDLDELSSVFVRLSRIGLTKKEVTICKLKICYELKVNIGNVDVWDIVPLVEGATLPPPRPIVKPLPAELPPADAAPAAPAPADAGTAPAPVPPAPDAPVPPKAQ